MLSSLMLASETESEFPVILPFSIGSVFQKISENSEMVAILVYNSSGLKSHKQSKLFLSKRASPRFLSGLLFYNFSNILVISQVTKQKPRSTWMYSASLGNSIYIQVCYFFLRISSSSFSWLWLGEFVQENICEIVNQLNYWRACEFWQWAKFVLVLFCLAKWAHYICCGSFFFIFILRIYPGEIKLD